MSTAEEGAPPPSLGEAMGWIGADLAAVDGGGIGQVQGFFVDSESGDPAWLIARLGRRRNTRVVAVPVSNCAGAGFGVWVAQEGARVRSAPVVDPTRPLRREHELTICSHFGVGSAVGRAAEVSARAANEITATPPGG